MRVYSEDFKKMKWDEFRALIGGLSPKTALGRIVSIRAEEDKEVLESYTPDMHKIRNEWRTRIAKTRTEQETLDFLESMKRTLIQMAGGEENRKGEMRKMRPDASVK